MHLDETVKRCFVHAFKANKIFLCYPILLVSSIIVVSTLAMLFNASDWIIFGVMSIPVYLTLGLLGSLSVFVHRLYYHELRGDQINYKDVIAASINRMIHGVAYALPLIITHLASWIFLGLFFLIKQIPYLGVLVAVLFSMLPFAFLSIILFLPLFTLFVLFYGSPYFAFDLSVELDEIKQRPATVFKNFFIAILPFIFALMAFGGLYWLTMDLFSLEDRTLATTLQRIFLLVPFSLYLTPFVIFFFHFSLESYRESSKKG